MLHSKKRIVVLLVLMMVLTTIASGRIPAVKAEESLADIDIYLIAGQSNAAGCSTYSASGLEALDTRYVNGFSNVLYAGSADGGNTSQSIQPVKAGLGMYDFYIGPELGMASALSETCNATTGKYAGIIKFALGGTSLVHHVVEDLTLDEPDWVSPSYEATLTKGVTDYTGALYDGFLAEVATQLEAYRKAGYNPTIQGLYWMQGEEDRYYPDKYPEAFQYFASDIRNDLTELTGQDLKSMPIVLGLISRTACSATAGSASTNQAFIAMQKTLPALVKNVYLNDSSEFDMNELDENGNNVSISSDKEYSAHWKWEDVVTIGKMAGNNLLEAAFSYRDEIIYTSQINDAVGLYNSNTAPTKKGYVFGGWFTDDLGTEQVTADTVAEGTTLYAKFVPAYVLSVKAQNHQNVEKTGNIRFVSSVDNEEHYKSVGFDAYFGNKTEEGYMLTAEAEMVYTRILVNKENGTQDEHWPKEVFGEQSQYFNIAEVHGISKDSFNSIIYVKPYWITNDGTKVYGLGKYVRVNDGINGVISIPVNIYTAQKIAAGLMEIRYPENLQYTGYTASSRLFGEMEVRDDETNHTLKCAGNIATAKNGDIAADTDLYVSLQFEVAEGEKVTVGKDRLNFTVTDATQFCNLSEELFDMSKYIWDIQY